MAAGCGFMGLWVLNRGGLLDAVWRKGRQESLLQFLRADVGTWVKKERARISVDVTLFVDGVKSKVNMHNAYVRWWWASVTTASGLLTATEVFSSDHDKKDKGRKMQKGWASRPADQPVYHYLFSSGEKINVVWMYVDSRCWVSGEVLLDTERRK